MAYIDHDLIDKTLTDGLEDRPYLLRFFETPNNNELDLYTTFLAIKIGLLNTTYQDVSGNQDRNKIDNLIYDPKRLIKDFDISKNLITKLKVIPTLQFLLNRIEAYIEGADKLLEKNKGDAIAQFWIDVSAPLLVKRALFEIIASPTLLLALLPNLGIPGVRITLNQEHLNKFNLTYLLDSLDTLYPKLKIKDLEAPLPPLKPVTGLFQRGHYQATDSSIISDALYGLLVGKTVELNALGADTAYVAQKSFSVGTVTIQMKLSKSQREALATEGNETRKVLHTLMSFAMKQPLISQEKIQVSGAEILKYMNQLYAKDRKGNRLSKIENLDSLAKQLMIIESMKVLTSEIKPAVKGKQPFSLTYDSLFELSFKLEGQRNLFGGSITPITDLTIWFKPGMWFSYFQTNDTSYYKNIGYYPQDVLSGNEYYSKILDWLSFSLEQHRTGDWKIGTVLRQTSYKPLLEELEVKYDRNKALTLFKAFNQAIDKIKSLQDPYQIEYRKPPEWILDTSIRKPKGWFHIWLETVIIFNKPLSLLPQTKEVAATKPKPKKVDIEALEKAIADSGLSRRAICEYLGHTHTWLTKKSQKGTITPKDQSDILAAIKTLSKRKSS